MILASFQIEDKLKKVLFFQNAFLLANISVKVVLKMFFLIFSIINIQFTKKKLAQRFYTTAKALSTTKQIKLIGKKKFAKVALQKNMKVFVIYMTFIDLSLMLIYLSKKTQIMSLFTKEMKIPIKYSNFCYVFLK